MPLLLCISLIYEYNINASSLDIVPTEYVEDRPFISQHEGCAK